MDRGIFIFGSVQSRCATFLVSMEKGNLFRGKWSSGRVENGSGFSVFGL